MKTVLSSTALVLALSAPAFADQHMGEMFVTAPKENVLRASELVGARLYVSESDVAEDQMGMNDAWDDAGEISEIVMGQDGTVDFIVADIGGFLGIGEKQVAVSLDQLQFVSDGENSDDWFIVLTAAQSDLENAPDFEGFDAASSAGSTARDTEQAAQGTMQEADQATGNTQAAQGGDTATGSSGATLAPQDGTQADRTATDGQQPMNQTGQDGRQQAAGDGTMQGQEAGGDYTSVAAADLTAEDMTGVRVYDGQGEWVGDVSELVLGQDGKTIEHAVIDVGGFLGIGEKPVALPIDDLQLQREGEGGALRVTVPMSKEELEAEPRWEG